MFDEISYVNNNDIEITLSEDYPEIFEAIKKEGYNLDFINYDVFLDIVFEDRTVGFITFEKFPFSENKFVITDAYVIPKFRGNNLLFNYLELFLTFDNFEYYPRKPTKAFINVLLKNDYAFKLTPNFVVSYFKFYVEYDEIYKNPRIKRFYKNNISPFPYLANLFDMDLCSVMFVDPELTIVKYSDFFAITEPRKYDFKKYKCRKKLKKVSEKYIDDKYAVWQNNFNKIESFIQRKNDEFNESILVENIIGSEEELCDDFKDSLNECSLSIDDGFKIRNHVVNGLKTGELNQKSYIQRLRYLLNHFEDLDKTIGEFNESIEECPFCGYNIPEFARSCLNCGLVIREIDFDEFALDNLNNAMKSLFEGFMEGNFFDDGVLIEENDVCADLKIFFNQHMADYDFDEFLEFYNSSDKSLQIDEIKDLFIEDKLNKSLGTKNEFHTYFISIVHYFYYNMEFDKFDDAFVNLVQMAILASNKSKDKNDILLSNPHSIDIFFAIEDLENSNHEFDVLKLFNQAIDTFKIDKYNKNHDEVLKELQSIFS